MGDADVDDVLRALPGIDGPEAETVQPILDAFDAPLDRALSARQVWLDHATDPLARLCHSLDLSGAQIDVFLLTIAVELSSTRQRLLAYVQDGIGLTRPTIGLLEQVWPRRGAAAVAPSSPLVITGMVELAAGPSWSQTMCTIPPRVMWAVDGDDSLDPGLDPEALVLSTSRHQATGFVPSYPVDEILLVCGADATTRRGAVCGLHPDRPVLCSPAPADAVGWLALVREATLRQAVLVLEPRELDPRARQWLTRVPGLVRVISTAGELPLETLPDVVWRELRVESATAHEADWLAATGGPAPPGVVVTRDQLARIVTARAAETPTVVRRLAGGHLDGIAVRVPARRTWADIVLPPEQLATLQGLAGRHALRHRVFGEWGFAPLPSMGTVALFSGPSGTGKTLAAEVVAGSLGLDLYKVDLSAVVSKYIGETEKRLERVFRAAESGELVLFFDEADALFGKRSEVNDAHDRYANIEVAFLLQRLEQHEGMVVLATNLHHNIDQAFLRRVAVSVDFVTPDVEQRRHLWQLAFPPASLETALDIDDLAREHVVTGGVIHNVARAAAFLAAAEGVRISAGHVVQALRAEYDKLGRLPQRAGLTTPRGRAPFGG